MKKQTITDTYPFTKEQLSFFKKEMNKAGDFEELMIEKKAMKLDGTYVISVFPDIEKYKEEFLTGVYEPLREHYDTEVPYMFWGKMYEALCGRK